MAVKTNKRLDWDDKKSLALGTAKAMNYLHKFPTPVIHRDLKSLNILIDQNLVPKIADFGWTRLKGKKMTSKVGMAHLLSILDLNFEKLFIFRKQRGPIKPPCYLPFIIKSTQNIPIPLKICHRKPQILISRNLPVDGPRSDTRKRIHRKSRCVFIRHYPVGDRHSTAPVP